MSATSLTECLSYENTESRDTADLNNRKCQIISVVAVLRHDTATWRSHMIRLSGGAVRTHNQRRGGTHTLSASWRHSHMIQLVRHITK